MLVVHCNASSLSLHCLWRTLISATFPQPFVFFCTPSKSAIITDFFDLLNSGGVKDLDLRAGTSPTSVDGHQVAIHYYGR
ncbi:hypothetical protein V6N13_144111 [Hibiscus sabdariffa]